MEIRVSGKIVEVEYAPDEKVTVERQHLVKAAIQKAMAERPVGLLVHVPLSLRQLDLSVASFWMGGMRELSPGLRAMAAVTSSRPLRFFAQNFSKTLELVGAKVQIKVFETADLARAWLEQVV
ncbi:MAG: STAS/SEC14 domain-containing protein [Archangium sp.]